MWPGVVSFKDLSEPVPGIYESTMGIYETVSSMKRAGTQMAGISTSLLLLILLRTVSRQGNVTVCRLAAAMNAGALSQWEQPWQCQNRTDSTRISITLLLENLLPTALPLILLRLTFAERTNTSMKGKVGGGA